MRALGERSCWQLAAALYLLPALAMAQGRAKQAPANHPAKGSDAVETEVDQTVVDASRGAFDRFLDSHPQISGDLYREPRLARDEQYVQTHPELEKFFRSHPQVKEDTSAYLSQDPWRFKSPERQTSFREFLDYFVPTLVFVIALVAVLWILRFIVESRRWNRMANVQAEVHNKLLEKFGSSQELVAYMESDAGRRFLESAPIMVEGAHRTTFPVGRILWSIQLGIILTIMGIGLNYVPAKDPDVQQLLSVLWILTLTLGLGFVLSAGVSYGLSKRLGLLGSASSGAGGAASTGTPGSLSLDR